MKSTTRLWRSVIWIHGQNSNDGSGRLVKYQPRTNCRHVNHGCHREFEYMTIEFPLSRLPTNTCRSRDPTICSRIQSEGGIIHMIIHLHMKYEPNNTLTLNKIWLKYRISAIVINISDFFLVFPLWVRLRKKWLNESFGIFHSSAGFMKPALSCHRFKTG